MHPGQESDQAVDPHAEASGWGQAVLEGLHVRLVHRAGLEVAVGPGLGDLFEPAQLLEGVVELAEGVSQLPSEDDGLEALGEVGIFPVRARQRR